MNRDRTLVSRTILDLGFDERDRYQLIKDIGTIIDEYYGDEYTQVELKFRFRSANYGRAISSDPMLTKRILEISDITGFRIDIYTTLFNLEGSILYNLPYNIQVIPYRNLDGCIYLDLYDYKLKYVYFNLKSIKRQKINIQVDMLEEIINSEEGVNNLINTIVIKNLGKGKIINVSYDPESYIITLFKPGNIIRQHSIAKLCTYISEQVGYYS